MNVHYSNIGKSRTVKSRIYFYFLLKYNLHTVKCTDFKCTAMSFENFHTCVTHTLVKM